MSSSQAISPDGISNPETAVSTEARKTSKMMCVEVIFLDNSTHTFQIQSKALGQMLFEKVCKFLNLLEIDYFGLEYADEKNTKYWLDSLKPLCRQTGLSATSPTMYFCVKFYTPDPVQLEDEFTRYLFSLQIKKDLAAGLLQCNDNTAALMISYIVQAESGDYDAEECPDHCYLSSYKFVPYQDADLQRKIMENHKKHLSQTPAEADLNLLETARRCELYGIKMTSAKDHEGVPLNLAVAHMGVLVFQNFTKINTFSWAKIRKLSFKRKRFLIKLHPEGYGYYKDTVEFYFEGRNECKNFWKKCIENHTFFRCTDSKKPPRQKPRIFSRGSSFRYSGRTQKQVAEFVRENYIKRQPFQRSTSLRVANSSHAGAIGTSVSAQPLLPVSSSLSCGSMAAIAQGSSPPPMKKLSSSEPTTPHIAQDAAQMLTNGNVMQDKQKTEGNSQDVSPAEDGFISQQSKLSVIAVDAEIKENIPVNGNENNNNTCLKPELYSKSVEESVADKICNEDDVMNCEDSKYSEDFKSGVEFIIKPQKEVISSILCAGVKNRTYSTTVTLENELSENTEKLDDIEKNKVIANDIISELNGHSPTQSEPSEESESGSLEESSIPIFIDSLHLLGIPPFCIDSFGSLSECRLMNNKKIPTDKAYYIAKELLMTERTYRRDLEIVNVVFRDEFSKQGDMPSEAVELMLSTIDPLYEVHCSLLRELEQQMAHWEGRPVKVLQNTDKGVGNILKHHIHMCKLYDTYMEKLPKILQKLTEALSNSQRFEMFYQQFEMHKMCYLPLTSFLLRPVHRIPYYCFLLQSLMNYYGNTHSDYEDCNDALIELQESSVRDESTIFNLINYVKLTELQRNLVGFNDLLDSERVFIREGCLQKLSKTGNQQRMFFLFSDLLLYTTRTPTGRLLFRVHGQLMLPEVKVQSAESRQGAAYCFTISKGNKTLLLAASSEKERTKWLYDLSEAINTEKNKNSNPSYSSQLSTKDNTELGDDTEDFGNENEGKSISHHVNTTVHVCWHRNISVSKFDLLLSLKYYLSGYLLRKFKNNSGWQKLWVVLSNLCLFFYKSYLDDSPLASLPLAGYRVDHPSPEDPITKDHVFKLQYKNHTYFFRAESQHTFNRWMEVISWATLQEEDNTHL